MIMKNLLIIAFIFSSFLGFSQLSTVEQEVLDEINLVRTDPSSYVQYIDNFLDYWDSGAAERKTAQELIEILENLEPLPELKYSEVLYESCKKHAKFLKRTGKFQHSDAPYAENIQYGNEYVRYAIIDLLIDHGVPDRGHRNNLLNPDIREMGVYYIEEVNENMMHLFVQQFK
ncbi:MAG: hypothetical protein C0596_11055 [Marinilabiliales bacterium]|nr:MAG: hypothetical protein C0596_11055 [Marinilabiliales bacterium]